MIDQSSELADLIARAQQNDQAAYEQIYERYVNHLYRYLYARCRDTTLAEELVGDVWLRVVQYLPRFSIPSSGVDKAFAAWLYRIGRNLLSTAMRKQRLQITAIPEWLQSSAPDLDDYMVTQDERLALAEALARLTPDQRDVILLRFQEDHPSADVATLTGRTQGAVKALQHRALNALARAMGASAHPGGRMYLEEAACYSV